MQVVVTSLDNLARQVKITLPAEITDKKIEARFRQVMRNARIDGFRQGKVPRQFVEKKFGKEIEFESLEMLAREHLSPALAQEKLSPASQPRLDLSNYERGKDFTFTVDLEVFPTITLKPFSDLIIEQAVAEVTEAEIEQTLEGMRKQQQQWVIVSREAAEGDRVEIDFLGKIDNVPFAGGKAENFSLVLGSNQMIPGFESSIIGQEINKEFTIDVNFPEGYHSKDLAGKLSQFDIIIHKIEAPELPMLDDAFAQKFGLSEGNVATLHQEVANTLIKQRDKALRRLLKQEVMEKLRLAHAEVMLPSALIQMEAVELRQQMTKKFKDMGQRASNLPLSDDMFIARAKERTLLGILLDEIIKQHHLRPEPTKVRQLIEEMAEQFDEEKAAKVVEWYYQDQKRLAEIEALALEEQIVDLITKEATLVEKTVLLRELLTPQGGN